MAHILLVDDNPTMLEAMKEALEFNGHQVVAGHDGSAGVTCLEQAGAMPDVIISDLHMPNIDGIELLHVLRESSYAQMPFIAISGLQADEDMAMDAGADAFLVKPFHYEELENLIYQLTSPVR
jgi:two-component system KDP operon response regulator KdpE